MYRSFFAKRIQSLFGIGLFVLIASSCAAPSGGGGDLAATESADSSKFTYINIQATDENSEMESNTRSGELVNSSRSATLADAFSFSVVCGNDASCVGSPAPSPALSAGTATTKCYTLSSYATGVVNNGTIPLVTSDDGTTKTFCRIKLSTFNYKNSGQNYTPSSPMVIDLDFRNAGAPSTQTSYISSGVLYTDSSGSNQGANLYGFYKYTNTSGSSNTAVGTIGLLFSTSSTLTLAASTATAAAGTSVADTIQSSTIFSPAISAVTYQAVPAAGSMVKQYSTHFTNASDLSAYTALTSSDSCRIFTMNTGGTTITINGSQVAIPSDLTSAQTTFLNSSGNMLNIAAGQLVAADGAVDCKLVSVLGSFGQWGTSIATPMTGSSTAVTLSSAPRLIVIASDATDTTNATTTRASRGFVIFKIPVSTASTTAW